MPLVSTKRLKTIFANKTNSCRSRKIDFLLTFEQVKALYAVEHCAYTGVAMTLTPSNNVRRPTDLTLERVDCSKGYTVENTIAVCNAANSAKAAFELVYRAESTAMLQRMAESLAKIDKIEHKYTRFQKFVMWIAKKAGLEIY